MRKMIRFVKCQVIMSAIALISVLAMASCEEHTDIYDSSIKVGNILLSDNTVVSPYGYDRDSHMAVGVIFYTNEDTALVVGTKKSWEDTLREELTEKKPEKPAEAPKSKKPRRPLYPVDIPLGEDDEENLSLKGPSGTFSAADFAVSEPTAKRTKVRRKPVEESAGPKL